MKKLSKLLNMDFPCGGKGICGKCKVSAAGDLSPLTETEKRLLSPKEILGGTRLACQTYLLGKATVTYKGESIFLSKDDETAKETQVTEVVNKGRYGIALDVGTTTVAAYLCSLPDIKVIKTLSFKNPQSRFGADVISRTEYAVKGGLSEIQSVLREKINPFGVIPEKYVVSGNTSMMHLFFGLSPKGLTTAPFTPHSLFGTTFENIYYAPPCISAFVGSDTLCALLSTSIEEDTMLLDIGTNGEMALFSKGTYYCTSVAAGPALEGVGISQGMIAEEGAIKRVSLEKGKVCYQTVKDAPAKGICGSGLVDAVSVMLKTGAMDKTGYMEKDFYISENVSLTQKDIRNFQLAKGAIRAGAETLIHRSGVKKISKIYLAGAMGNAFDVKNLVTLGILPKGVEIIPVGNAAGEGAVLLMGEENIKKAEEIASKSKAINLATDTFFAEKFIECMNF